MARFNQLVIGVTGPIGSGVTTLSEVLKEKGEFLRVSLSDGIKAEFRTAEGLAADAELTAAHRKKLQDLGDQRRQECPGYWVSKAMEKLGPAISGGTEIVVDGIRNPREVDALREQFSKFFLIAANASASTRWNRVQEGYKKDLHQFERDDKRDSDSGLTYGQQVARCVQDADYVVLNDEHVASTKARQERLWGKLKDEIRLMRECDIRSGGFRRPPSPAEAYMATGYAQASISQCLKRHVGAVIVSAEGIGLSMGYNENPAKTLPCVSGLGYCFKDTDMDGKLEAMRDFFCPTCGKKIKKIVPPWKCPECDDNLKLHFFPDRNMTLCTAIHAEERAIKSLSGRSAEGGILFTTTFPCFQCSRQIVDARIAKVVYVEAYPVKEAMKFLIDNGVTVEPFEGFKARSYNLIFKQVE